MTAIDNEAQQTFSAGKLKVLFEGSFAPTPGSFPDHDISPNDQRFLMFKPTEEEQSVSQITVVQDWVEESKQEVATGTK